MAKERVRTAHFDKKGVLRLKRGGSVERDSDAARLEIIVVIGILGILGDDKIVFAKRSKEKTQYPEFFTLLTTGHSNEGESILETAKREGKQEVGIVGLPLQLVHRAIQERADGQTQVMYYYIVHLDDDTKLTFRDGEVTETVALTEEEFEAFFAKAENKLVPLHYEIVRHYYALLRKKTEKQEAIKS